MMKYIKLFENWINESEVDWQDLVMDACSNFEHKFPNGLSKLCAAKADEIYDDEELGNLYNKAAMCIVEPNVAVGKHNLDLNDYNEKSEQEGFKFVIPTLREMPNGDKWKCIVDLIEEIGY